MKKILTLLLICHTLVYGQVPEKIPNSYVHDYSATLSASEIQVLNQKIRVIEDSSSVQIALVLLKDLPQGAEVADFALQIGRTWHVGDAENGLVYVAAINAHKQAIQVARKLEGDFPDIKCLEIQDGIKPFFRSKDYNGGFNYLVDRIRSELDPVQKEQLKLAADKRKLQEQKVIDTLGTIGLWAASLGLISLLIWYLYYRPKQKIRKLEDQTRRWNDMLKAANEKHTNVYRTPVIPLPHNRKNTIPYKKPPSKESSSPSVIIPIIPLYDSGSSSSDNSSSSSSNSDDSSSSSFGDYSGGGDSGFSGGGASSDW